MATTLVEAEVVVHQENEKSQKVIVVPPEKDPDPDATDFKEVNEGNTVKYECNICKKRFAKPGGAKSFIKKTHNKKDFDKSTLTTPSQKKRKPASEFFEEDEENEKKQKLEEENDDTEGFLKEIETYWDKPENNANEKEGDNDTNENKNSTIVDVPCSQDLPLPQTQ